MRTWIKGLLVLTVVTGFWLGLVLTEWLPLATAEQQAAQAALRSEQSVVKGASNAFATLWLFDFDAPESEWDALARADVDAFAAAVRGPGPVSAFRSRAEGRYGLLAKASGNEPEICALWQGNCLEQVRASPEATRLRLARYADRLARGERLHAHDHFDNLFEPHMEAPLAAPGVLFSLQLTASALDFVDGRTDEAFDRLCRHTRTWRRLRDNADSMVTDMLGVAQMSSAARVYSEMLAELPLSFEPPCTDAFAPLNDSEFDQCPIMRLEYESASRSFEQLFDGAYQYLLGAEAARPRLGAMLVALANREHVSNLLALELGKYCQDGHRERIAARSREPLDVHMQCGAMDWAFDPVGCRYLGNLIPNYEPYYWRVLDLDGRMRMFQAALWWRAQLKAAGRAPDFAARPAHLSSREHEMQIDPEAGELRLRAIDKARGEFWTLRIHKPQPQDIGSPGQGADEPSPDPAAAQTPGD